eukprot:CAMPEP_0182910012 /NCGR_PEP_ID=MMETSP0034_2-20130328/36068_1 /TAXON_ID=156128 /ORGANISM="Nephroselmis pyriformis, Strain CCMP717" /LENGTH=436 /DNA_ID=CAMNT_0025046305 /DNA_START=80 /DNA_END=1386 /DNA_ORIENTATION=-
MREKECRALTLALALALVAAALPTSHAQIAVGDGRVVELEVGNLDETLDAVPEDDFCLVEFYASWCPACQRFRKHYERIAAVFNQDPRPRPNIYVARLDCQSQGEMCKRFNIKGYPTMVFGHPSVFVGKDGKDGQEVKSQRTADGVMNWINKHMGTHHQLIPELPPEEADTGLATAQRVQSGQKLALAKRANPELVDMGDVEKATVAAFDSIFSEQALSAHSRDNFVKFAELLAAAHPIASCRTGGASLLSRLDTLWPQKFLDAVPTQELRRFRPCGRAPPPAAWGSCEGSSPGTRGYTCGLWLMFHTLAAGMDEGRPDAGLAFVEAMRGFMDSFFGCDECRGHFLEMAAKPAARAVRSKRDAVMWLWRSHNLVNARIRKEEAARGDGDPAFPKEQWPSPHLCPECHRGGDLFAHDDAMYLFLLRYYGARDASAGA